MELKQSFAGEDTLKNCDCVWDNLRGGSQGNMFTDLILFPSIHLLPGLPICWSQQEDKVQGPVDVVPRPSHRGHKHGEGRKYIQKGKEKVSGMADNLGLVFQF